MRLNFVDYYSLQNSFPRNWNLIHLKKLKVNEVQQECLTNITNSIHVCKLVYGAWISKQGATETTTQNGQLF